MNYFEIINKTLIELNFAPASAFSDLTKLEHKRLMNVIDRLNKEICNMNSNFYFRQITKKISLYQNKKEYAVDLNGKISKVIGESGEEYSFEPDYSKFYSNHSPNKAYSFYGGKYIFSPSDEKVCIFYSTDDFVISKNGELKADFSFETDESIIPENFQEKLFVNGAAYNFKQNASHPKYAHWKQEYDKTLGELLSEAKKVSGSEIIIDGGYRKLS